MKALVLVTVGLRDGQHHDVPQEVHVAAERLGARVAALQGDADPSLVRVLDDLAGAGAQRVRLIGVTRSGSDTGVSWVRRVAGHWVRTRHSLPAGPAFGTAVGGEEGATGDITSGSEAGMRTVMDVEVAPSLERDLAELAERADLGEAASVSGAASPTDESWRRVTGREAPLTCPSWDEPPAYRHHVFVCRGPRCSAQGADDVSEALSAELSRRGLLDSPVLVAQTGCLYPCNLAPTIVVHPANTWHGPLHPDEIPRFVDDHLAGARLTAPQQQKPTS